MKLIDELKRRNVFRAMGVYAAAALIVVQVSDIVFPRLYLPDWTVTFIIILVIIGFPITFFFSWTYNMYPNKGLSSDTNRSFIKNLSIKKILFPLTGFILTVIGGLFWFIYPFLSIGIGEDRDYDAAIAVLYMENMSTEENSYFADGLTEELINRLSRIQNIKIKPRTDVAVYKDNPVPINQIANELNADYIVEGSVRIIGENLRVNAKLINIIEDKTVWSNSYNNKLTDIFMVQDGIAAQIVEQLNEKLTISSADISATRRASTGNMEAYNLVDQAINILLNRRISNANIGAMVIPLMEKAISLDSTYAEAYSYLALGKLLPTMREDYSEEMDIIFEECMFLLQKALSYNPDHELAGGLSIMIPMAQMQISENFDVFKVRRLAIQMDAYLSKFPDSPFALSVVGFFYGMKYMLFEDEADITIALEMTLKSHEIIKKSIFKIKDPLYLHANNNNFDFIPQLYMIKGKHDEALEFVIDNKKMICLDGTYECLETEKLNSFEGGFYHSFYYEEALELIDITLSRTADELNLEGEDIGIKKQAYYRTGMINMKWGEYAKAIEGFMNAEKLVLDYPDVNHAAWWSPHYKLRIGQTYMLMKNYKKAAEYYLKSFNQARELIASNERLKNNESEHNYWTERESICYYGYLEGLLNNHESSEKHINECIDMINTEIETRVIKGDTAAYGTFLPLYLYYNHIENQELSKKYINLAYESIGEEDIRKYHEDPNRETNPKRFYSRDIIKAYENN